MTASASFFPTLSGHILPRLFAGHPITRQVFLVLAGSAFIALLAQFVIRLPVQSGADYWADFGGFAGGHGAGFASWGIGGGGLLY